MEVFSSSGDLRTKIAQGYFKGKSLGFVPTMGALHDGHISLVARSRQENDLTAVSIFVNPTQFGPNEDFTRYPRTEEKDLEMLKKEGVDFVFLPTPADIYPYGKSEETVISSREMGNVLCGRSRPGHFNGVLQVVNKLFNIVQPDRAYFGLKDFQQFAILRRMVQEFFHPVEMIGCPIVRESDGLAMSSRNRYLTEEERAQAVFLIRALEHAKKMSEEGEASPEALRSSVENMKAQFPLVKIDYFEILHESDLSAVSVLERGSDAHAFIAAWLGKTRLIDNLPLFHG